MYVGGAVIALLVMRDRWLLRLVTALAWPLGPLAFIVVIALLYLASVVLWPVRVLTGTGVLAGAVWLIVMFASRG